MKDLIIAVRADLRTEINNEVFGFPSELIGIIGSHLGTRDRLKAISTCRYMRKALLGNRTLWTNIDCSNIHLALFFLKLAEGCPLNVSITIPDSQTDFSPPLLRALNKSATHIEALSVEYHTPMLYDLLSGAGPSLKTLKIEIHRYNPTPKIPSCEFPALESLTFTNKPVYLLAPCLTRLTFEGDLFDEEILPFLSLLSRFPQLRELAVAHYEIYQEDGPVVELKNLHTYTDYTNNRYTWHLGLYRRLSLPEKEKCSVIFRIGPRVIKPDSARLKCEIPRSVNPDRIRMKITRSHRQDGSQGQTENRVDGLMEVVDSTTGHRFCLTLGSDHGPRVMMEGFMESLPSGGENTKMLCLESDHISLCPPQDLFSHFPKLETLILSCNDVVPYLQRPAWFQELDSIVIRNRHSEGRDKIVLSLVGLAQSRDSKLRSALLFSPESQGLGSPEVVDSFVKTGGDFTLRARGYAKSWNVDDYFLKGLRH